MNWTDAAALQAVPEGEVIGVELAGREIALYRVEGELHATDLLCTHGQTPLCEGFLEGHEIECPLHQGRFDIRTGRATCAPAERPLRIYPVKVEGERVFVALG